MSRTRFRVNIFTFHVHVSGLKSKFRPFQDLKTEWEISYQSYNLGLRIITRLQGDVICYGKTKFHYFKNPISSQIGLSYFSVKQVKVNKFK